MTGALQGLRVVELGGIGPAPHAAMLLADLGADVVRVERPSGGLALGNPARDVVLRGRRSVHADLRDPGDLDGVLALVDRADVLIDPFRPGVTDRLGLGPDTLAERNPGLIYARMTGWGADGPLAERAGHDLNYLSLTGVLHAIGSDAQPAVPLNVVGDYGGGSLYLVVGVLAALFERERSGRGQVVDAAIVDGVVNLAQLIWSMRGQGLWQDRRRSNLLDGGAPFYDTYVCAGGGHVAVGAIEPQFYAALLEGLGLSDEQDLPGQFDLAGWPRLRARLTEVFAGRTRDEWAEVFAGTDGCVTPVLTFDEAPSHPHLAARGTIVDVDGLRQAAPAPRLSRTPATPGSPPEPGSTDLDDVRRDWQA